MVDSLLTAWTMKNDKLTVMKTLGDAGVLAGAILAPEDLINDEAMRERGAIVTVKHPVRGEFRMPAFPVKMSDSKVAVAPAPLLGADTEDVYGKLLGLKPERIAELREKNVI